MNKKRQKKKRNKKYQRNRNVDYFRRKVKDSESSEALQGAKDKLSSSVKLYLYAQFSLVLILFVLVLLNWWENGFSIGNKSFAERINNVVFYIGITIPGFVMIKQSDYLKQSDLTSHLVRSSWRKVIVGFLVCFIIIFFTNIFRSFYSDELKLSIYSSTFFAGLLILHQSFVIYGFRKPHVIFDKMSLYIVSSIKLSTIFCSFYTILGVIYPNALINTSNFILGLFVVIITNFILSLIINTTPKFSSVNQILNYADVSKIRLAISKYSNSRLAKLRAKNEFDRMLKLGDFEFMQELAKKVNSHNESSKKRSIIVALLFGFTMFVFTSVGEGLVQDLLNDRIKEVICNFIGFYCN